MADPCAEYPKACYRDGGREIIWGSAVETRVLTDADDEMEALATSWRLHPIAQDEPLTFSEVEPVAPKRRGRPSLNRTPVNA